MAITNVKAQSAQNAQPAANAASTKPTANKPAAASAPATSSKDALKVTAKAQSAPGYPEIGAIRTMQNINDIAGQGLSYFTFDNLPSYEFQVQKLRTRRDGTQYYETTYNWSAAFADVTAKLNAISAIAGSEDNPQCQQIANMARQAVMTDAWEYALDEGSAESRYLGMSTTLREIQQITNDTPPQPGETMGSLNNAVAGADNNIRDLRNQMGNATLKQGNLDQRVADVVTKDHAKANSVPWWHFLLLFGFFQKHGANSAASDAQADLDAYKAANPDDLQQRLDAVKSRAAQVADQASHTYTIDGARQLQGSANPVTSDAGAIRDQAGTARDKVKDLIDKLNGK